MTLKELNDTTLKAITPTLGDREARATVRLLLEDDLGITPTKLVLNPDRVMEPETVNRFARYAARIAAGEPPQYVIGRARFMGMDLKVTPATLIPRPETEGLVDLITDCAAGRSGLRVLDIGTGSGCIAIALARALPFASVSACDISTDALAVARENGHNLHTGIDFFQADILSVAPPAEPLYDIIVSNPPYIADHERADMDARVYDHEPASALFVPDSDPLRFYRAISVYALKALVPGGRLYFEINPLYATELRQILKADGWTNIDIIRDYLGHLRFASATLPS